MGHRLSNLKILNRSKTNNEALVQQLAGGVLETGRVGARRSEARFGKALAIRALTVGRVFDELCGHEFHSSND